MSRRHSSRDLGFYSSIRGSSRPAVGGRSSRTPSRPCPGGRCRWCWRIGTTLGATPAPISSTRRSTCANPSTHCCIPSVRTYAASKSSKRTSGTGSSWRISASSPSSHALPAGRFPPDHDSAKRQPTTRGAVPMTDVGPGQVVTFYSYKGGTGRTMALANVAWILAANGKRVLVADWDLESPGLHRFFHPFIDAEALGQHRRRHRPDPRVRVGHHAQVDGPPDRWHERLRPGAPARVLAATGRLPGRAAAGLPVRRPAEPRLRRVRRRPGLGRLLRPARRGQFFDALRADMKRNYDYTLIDSRTGLSDVADICTIHLPDMLVDCFTLSEQGIDGAAQVAQHGAATGTERRASGSCRCRCGSTRPRRRGPRPGGVLAKQRFAGLPAGLTEAERDALLGRGPGALPGRTTRTRRRWRRSATRPGQRHRCSAAYEALTGHITDGAVTATAADGRGAAARGSTALRAARPRRRGRGRAAVRAGGPGLGRVDRARAASPPASRVDDRWPPRGRGRSTGARHADDHLAANVRHDRGCAIAGRPATRPRPLAVYVGRPAPLRRAFPCADVGLPGRPAGRRGGATGCSGWSAGPAPDAGDDPTRAAPAFPGTEPDVFNAPARNARFTGREDDLRELRAQLRVGRGVGAAGVPGRAAGHGRHRQDPGRDGVRPPVPATPTTWSGGSTPDPLHVRRQRRWSTSASELGPARRSRRARDGASGAAGAEPGEPYARWLLDLRQRRGPERVEPVPAAGPRPRAHHVAQPGLGRPAPTMPGRRVRARGEHRPPAQRVPTISPRRPTGSPRCSATCRSRSPRPAPGSPRPAPRSPSTCSADRAGAAWRWRPPGRRSRRPGTCRCTGCRSGRRRRTGCCSSARCSPPRSPWT